MRQDLQLGGSRSGSLVDVIDRVLDKGVVDDGDIKVSLADAQHRAIRVRRTSGSIDEVEGVGLDVVSGSSTRTASEISKQRAKRPSPRRRHEHAR
jgi:hypothetical protein